MMLAIGHFGWQAAQSSLGIQDDTRRGLANQDSVQATSQANDSPADVPLFPIPKWTGSAVPEAADLREAMRQRVMSVGKIRPEALANLAMLKLGDKVSMALEPGLQVHGVIQLAQGGTSMVISGHLGQGQDGTFMLSSSTTAGISGQILLPSKKLAYQLLSDGEDVAILKRPLGDLLCEGIPRQPGPLRQRAARANPEAALAIPALDSLPGAAGVLYLDFDGETVIDPRWNGGLTINAEPATFGYNGDPITAAVIQDVWERVAEDFKPYNVTVTTIKARYTAARDGNRMRCIVTPTTDAAPGSGGVAYLKSYRGTAKGFSADIPCWCFNDSTASIMAMTISHEFGHTFNLKHDGNASETYYPGHGLGTNTSWGALMGAPFFANITQWSKGEYTGANNKEDDLLIIQNTLEEPNGVGNGYQPDDAGDTIASAVELIDTGKVDLPGIISSATDEDYYLMRSVGGAVKISALLANDPIWTSGCDC